MCMAQVLVCCVFVFLHLSVFWFFPWPTDSLGVCCLISRYLWISQFTPISDFLFQFIVIRKFCYFCDTQHFKITGVMMDNITYQNLRNFIWFLEYCINKIYPFEDIHTEDVALFPTRQYFPCDLTYQISLLSLVSFFLLGKRRIFWHVPRILWKTPKLLPDQKDFI